MTVLQRDSKFYGELKKLNEDLIDYLKLSHDKSPYFDFSPPVKDYMKQLAELMRQFPEKENGVSDKPILSQPPSTPASIFAPPNQNPAPQPSPAPTFSFSSTLSTSAFKPVPSFAAPASTPISTTTTSTTPAPLFSAPQQASSSPFVFGSVTSSSSTNSIQTPIFSTSSAASTTPAQSSFFSFPKPPTIDDSGPKFGSFMAPAASAAPSGGGVQQTDGDGEEDHLPPVAKIDKYEEPDSIYSVRCKLYEKVAKSPGSSEYVINTLGIGVMYLKTLPDTKNLQMIIRQDPDLLRVLLNKVVTPTLPLKIVAKTVQIVFPGTAGGTHIYIMKTKDDSESKKTFETLMSFRK